MGMAAYIPVKGRHLLPHFEGYTVLGVEIALVM
jgi:hypothetical protein